MAGVGHEKGAALDRGRADVGFTILELMVVVVVIGVLATIVVQNYGSALRTSNEGSTRANLSAIRNALSVYVSDHTGAYPADLSGLTGSAKYLRKIPKARTPSYHPDSAAALSGSAADDAGGWLYNAATGGVSVNCTHTDSKGRLWTEY